MTELYRILDSSDGVLYVGDQPTIREQGAANA
jgi:hypothetical protein